MTFDKGTLILVNYTARVKDTGEVFETTLEEDAKQHSIYQHDKIYQPKLISVGESWVHKGFDEALANTSAGDTLSVDVSADKGFGERDTGKVSTIPIRKLGDEAEKVSVGDEVTLDKKKGIIRFIGSGRVQIDYNHKYAGKALVYDATILKSIDTDDDKILELLNKHLPVGNGQPQFKNSAGVLDVEIPSSMFRQDGLSAIKYFAQLELFKFVPSLEKIRFTETYESNARRSTQAATAPSTVAAPSRAGNSPADAPTPPEQNP